MKKESNFGYYFVRAILKPIYLLLYHPKIIGKENLPKEGPVIFCGNHRHVLDQCPVLTTTKLPVHYMAKKEYFDGKMAWFFKLSGCISVNRAIHDEEAKARAINILKNNGAIGIFPEGTRNKTIGTAEEVLLLPFKFGAVSMAKKTNATIVPFGLMGDHKVGNRNLTLVFGKPFKVENMELEEANELLRAKIESLALEANELGNKRLNCFKKKISE